MEPVEIDPLAFRQGAELRMGGERPLRAREGLQGEPERFRLDPLLGIGRRDVDR